MGFDAFISYSHDVDAALATQIQRGLSQLARPVFERRALRVFRDETGLSTNPHLWAAIEAALLESEWFVLLASPESAASAWVQKEVDLWLQSKSIDRILLVVTKGALTFDIGGRADRNSTNCLPPALLRAYEAEPRWLDMRWARGGYYTDLKDPRFRSAIADLAAPIHGVPKEDLDGEDLRQQRRSRRIAWIAALAVVVLAITSVTTVTLLRRRSDEIARQHAATVAAENEARARQQLLLANNYDAAARERAAAEPPLALLYAVQAVTLAPTAEHIATLQSLETNTNVDKVIPGPTSDYIDLTRIGDGRLIFNDGHGVQLWKPGAEVTETGISAMSGDDFSIDQYPRRSKYGTLASSNFGDFFAVATSSSISLYDGASLSQVTSLPTWTPYCCSPPGITMNDSGTKISAFVWQDLTVADIAASSDNGYDFVEFNLHSGARSHFDNIQVVGYLRPGVFDGEQLGGILTWELDQSTLPGTDTPTPTFGEQHFVFQSDPGKASITLTLEGISYDSLLMDESGLLLSQGVFWDLTDPIFPIRSDGSYSFSRYPLPQEVSSTEAIAFSPDHHLVAMSNLAGPYSTVTILRRGRNSSTNRPEMTVVGQYTAKDAQFLDDGRLVLVGINGTDNSAIVDHPEVASPVPNDTFSLVTLACKVAGRALTPSELLPSDDGKPACT